MMLGLFADDGMNFGAGDSLDMLVSMLINVLETESQLWCLAGRAAERSGRERSNGIQK